MRSLANKDFSDLELLHIIVECADRDGIVDAAVVAERLGITANGKRTPAGTVSARFSWMRRYGYLERIDPRALGLQRKDGPRWLVTQEGAQLLRRPSQRALAAVQRMSESEALIAQRELAIRAFEVSGVGAFSHAMRRQWQHTYANSR